MGFEPGQVKTDFPALQQDIVYLDNAATSQKPRQVIERVKRFYEEENANVGRGLYRLATDATKAYGDARRTVAEFIGADADELIFVKNTTEAMNLLAESLEIDGDIVLADMAHHSEQLPWRENYPDRVNYIPTEDGRIDTEAAESIIDGKTGIVAVPHISNTLGCVNDLNTLVGLARENDAYIAVDAAQSVPNMPVDVKQLDVDFLAFSGHKMLGPTGIGGLYVRREILEHLKPYQVGGGMVNSVAKNEVSYISGPGRFEPGTPNVAGAVGLAEAVRYLEQLGMSDVRQHELELSQRIVEGLETIEGVKVLSSEGASLVSFTAEYAHPHDVAEILAREGICVRAGHHCAQPQMEELGLKSGTVRTSPYIYNTGEDVERMIEAVKKVQEVFSTDV